MLTPDNPRAPDGEELSAVPASEAPTNADAEVEHEAAAAQPQPDRSAIQRRIDKLYAQKKAAEEAAEAERQKVRELEAKLAELQAPRSTSFWQAPAPQEDLKKALQEVLAPVVERLDRHERTLTLAAQHEQSWAAAESEFPEITQPNSELRALAEDIISRDPELQASTNGPYKAVLLARGLLADARLTVARKRAAEIPAASGEGQTTDRSKLQKELNQILKRGIQSFADYQQARELRRRLNS